MNKDVIYIDVDEDITAIIGKVKDSKEKVVALVPPKRIGVLQSAVNLRILQRTAKTADKRLVLISNDPTLMPLAASAGLPVAKNLQSKPEIPEIDTLKADEDDDIIDGSELPAAKSGTKKAAAVAPVAAKHIPVSDEPKKFAKPPVAGAKPSRPRGTQKIPNFNRFRKKFLLIGLAVLLLILFLLWAIFMAPAAKIIITAKTSPQGLNTSVNLTNTGMTDAAKGTLKSVTVQDKQDMNVDFVATGTRDEGKAASGTMTLTNSSSTSAVNVPVGTGFSSGECTFVTSQQASIPGVKPGGFTGGGFTVIPGSTSVNVKATDIGEQCNLSSRDYQSTASGVKAKGSDMSGGSKKTLKIVTQSDVQKASEQLAQQNSDAAKAKLTSQLKGKKIIDSSFKTDKSEPASTPQIGQEAPDGKAKLAASVTYSLSGVETGELDTFIKDALKDKLGKNTSQRVYDAGVEKAQITNFAPTNEGATATVIATGKVGPQIKDDDIKQRTMGKRFGDIQGDLKSIEGIDDVQVQFSYFWVNTVPKDKQKIKVEFNVVNAK